MVKQLTLLFSFFLTTIAFSQGNNPYFAVNPAKFNADDAEIGVYKNPGNNALILISSKEWGIVKRVNGNDQHFFNYFTVDAKSNKVSKFQRKSNSKFNEGPLCFTPDGKRVFFTRNSKKKNLATQKRELMLFTAEVSTKGKWSNITPCISIIKCTLLGIQQFQKKVIILFSHPKHRVDKAVPTFMLHR